MDIQNILNAPPRYRDNQENPVRFNTERLGLGLGNINTRYSQQNNFQQNIPMQQMQVQQQRPVLHDIVPMLDKDQNVGWQAHADVSLNLDYLRYGGKVAGRLGDMTVALNDSNQTAQGYRANSQGAMLQYAPSQIDGLIAQAGVQHDTNRFGYDKNTTSIGAGYNNPRESNFSGNITASRAIDNSGIPNDNIKANIGYRFGGQTYEDHGWDK